jgi:predicted nucleotidyltransferase
MQGKLITFFEQQSAVTIALLFGSVASGSNRPESDIDIAVLAKTEISSPFKKSLIEQISLITGTAVDIVDLRNAGQPLLGQIICNAKRLKGSSSDLAALYSRNAIDAADFMPYVSRTLKERQIAWTN